MDVGLIITVRLRVQAVLRVDIRVFLNQWVESLLYQGGLLLPNQ